MCRFLKYTAVYLLCGLLIMPPLFILIVTSWQEDLYDGLLGPMSAIPYWLWFVPIGAGAAILVWSAVAFRKPVKGG
jgi:hypothetical protein